MRRYNLPLTFIAIFCSGTMAASLTEQQTVNDGINDGQGWQASYGTWSEQVRTDNGYLSVAGIGGAGQYFAMNGKSKYQIATCTALKSSSWAGFGVTYYDASWNEIHIVRKQITADIRNGDLETRYAIGIVFPDDAIFAYLWVWNNDASGYVQVDGFRVVNYFPNGHADFDASQDLGNQYTQTFPAGRNLLVNGEFETTEFEGDEFWDVVDEHDSVYFTPSVFGTSRGLHIGSSDMANLVYQRNYELQPGQQFSLYVRGGRSSFYRDSDPDAVVGVDFLDSDGIKIGDVSSAITEVWESGSRGGPAVEVINFTPPSDMACAVVWVWVDALVSIDEPLWLKSLVLREREFIPPSFELDFATDVTNASNVTFINPRISDNDEVDLDSLDENDITVSGPNGQERDVSFNVGGLGPPYRVTGFDSSDNGTWTILYTAGEVADITGNVAILPYPGATSQAIGTFEVNISP